jgi:hypothetical protein
MLTTGPFLELKRIIVNQIYEEAVKTIQDDKLRSEQQLRGGANANPREVSGEE